MRFAAAFLLLFSLPVHAIEFARPIDCLLGEECFIQKYVDMAEKDAYGDYRCGHLSSDKHKGTDIRLRNYPAMEAGVNVLAAADGMVANLRDGEPDINVKDNPHYDDSRGCGNIVILRHEDGYETFYCHMKQNSIAVQKGQHIKTGDVLGKVGLSGNTQFPHLHFGVKKDGKDIDPFNQQQLETGCQMNERAGSLWKNTPPYAKTTILSLGVHDGKADAENARKGEYSNLALPPKAGAMVGWVDVMAPKKDDVVTITIVKPDGSNRSFDTTIPKDKAQWFQFSGMKRKTDFWDSGEYRLKVTVTRGEEIITQEEKAFVVK